MNRANMALYFVLLSTVAAMLILVMFYVGSERETAVSRADRVSVGGVFIGSCLLCISMTISPNWVWKALGRPTGNPAKRTQKTNERRYRGHHPDCVNFQSHRISIGDRDLCSGCLGLMAGAVISIALMVTYIVFSENMHRNTSIAFLTVGFIAISIAYVETSLKRRLPIVHVLVNGFMVIGFFLLVVGILGATSNGVAGLLVVSFSFLWMDTRIQLSLWRHSLVCAGCPSDCKMY